MKSPKEKSLAAGQRSIASFFKTSQPAVTKTPLQEPPPNKVKPAAIVQKPQQSEVVKQEAVAAGKGPAGGPPLPAAAKQDALQGAPLGAELLGKRVAVFWPSEKSWFNGVVKKFNGNKGKHYGLHACGPSYESPYRIIALQSVSPFCAVECPSQSFPFLCS